MAWLAPDGKWRACGYFMREKFDLGGHRTRERAELAVRLFSHWAKKGQLMPPPKIYADF